MMLTSIGRLMAIIAIASLSFVAKAQPGHSSEDRKKPYKILTTGRQITVKSTKDIKNIMVWTSSGHRIVEQREINEPSFSFQINVSENVFFIMIQYEGAKPFTEKIGI